MAFLHEQRNIPSHPGFKLQLVEVATAAGEGRKWGIWKILRVVLTPIDENGKAHFQSIRRKGMTLLASSADVDCRNTGTKSHYGHEFARIYKFFDQFSAREEQKILGSVLVEAAVQRAAQPSAPRETAIRRSPARI